MILNKFLLIIFLFLIFSINASATTNCSMPNARYEDMQCALSEVESVENKISFLNNSILNKLTGAKAEEFNTENKQWKLQLDSDVMSAEMDEGGLLGRLMRVNYKLDLLNKRIEYLKSYSTK